MLIDRSHRGWALFAAVFLLVTSLLYVAYARTWPTGPSGRTWPGMLFGVAGTLLMLFAGLLSVRKKFIRARLGSLSWWLKGHLWLGLLSVPLIFFHAAFRWGGWLETVLWITLAIVVVSGLVGLALQNMIPRTMKLQLTGEVIADQLPEVCRRLTMSADEKIAAHCTPAVVEAALKRSADAASAQDAPLEWLAAFYVHTVRPFLGPQPLKGTVLASNEQAQLAFERVRALLPETSHEVVDWLERSCQDRRQLAQQERLYRWLHGWLGIHIPVSIALLVFAAAHIVSALYY